VKSGEFRLESLDCGESDSIRAKWWPKVGRKSEVRAHFGAPNLGFPFGASHSCRRSTMAELWPGACDGQRAEMGRPESSSGAEMEQERQWKIE